MGIVCCCLDEFKIWCWGKFGILRKIIVLICIFAGSGDICGKKIEVCLFIRAIFVLLEFFVRIFVLLDDTFECGGIYVLRRNNFSGNFDQLFDSCLLFLSVVVL